MKRSLARTIFCMDYIPFEKRVGRTKTGAGVGDRMMITTSELRLEKLRCEATFELSAIGSKDVDGQKTDIIWERMKDK